MTVALPLAALSVAVDASRRLLRPAAVLAVAGLALSACSDARRAIGLERVSPDEFTVVSRAPLTLPPDMRSLPPPQPGAVRPQEGSTANQAAGTVFGKPAAGKKPAGAPPAAGASSGQQALLSQAGAKGADSDIRRKVNQETGALIVADKSWVDSLLFWRGPRESATMVNPTKESQRLREAAAEGKPLTDGETPTIGRKVK